MRFRRGLALGVLALSIGDCGRALAAGFELKTAAVDWEQVARNREFTVFVEREELSVLDRVSRMIFAVQMGAGGSNLNTVSVQWQVRQGEAVIAQGTAPLSAGLADVSFSLAGLTPGRYDILGEFKEGANTIGKGQSFFRMVTATEPSQKGRIPILLPRGVSAKAGFPVNFGVPFPKGALWSEANVRVVSADGAPVPAQFTVRSRWGHTPATSIRWLGVDFQPGNAPAWWPERQDRRYFLEFGPEMTHAVPTGAKVTVTDTADGIEVDTGAMQFFVRRRGFNLLDNVRIGGKAVLPSAPQAGLYLIDHEANTYRAANDSSVTLTVEEQGDQRVTLRAEGWYVKDGTDGALLNYTLPTDKLCKFITRIEAYAGRSYVRVLNTWVLTFDSFTVRLRDVGFSLPVRGCSTAEFGVEDGPPIVTPVPAAGVYLIQHLPDRFDVEDGAGTALQNGRHSAGWLTATTPTALVSVGHRDTWQRFPKEFEVLPDALRFHFWPAHGRKHPNIDESQPRQIGRLWFAHQGAELNLTMPWSYYFAVAQMVDKPDVGVYSPAGMPMAGIHASAMGTANTSDVMIHFAAPGEADTARDTAACFQTAPHALADTQWLCDSLAVGWMQPYSPNEMQVAEETISDMMRGYWETQDSCGEYGMWLYRTWHHGALRAPGQFEPYRIYNATHHYEAFLPWMLYARSGDPFYLMQGSANIRLLTDVQVVHYDDGRYGHREFHSGEGRLVGSTKHTNGFSTWGGDHAVLAHLTCYNGMLLAYYLTGDLRLREVVVDEWQKTLISDRRNPQFARADRTQNRDSRDSARDVTNSLGELIDLYQLTYHPAVLAHMAPLMDAFLNKFMRPWGVPVLNVVLFYGSEQARRQILDGVEEYRQTGGKPADPKSFWYTHAPFENFAMAAIINPQSHAQVDAWLSARVVSMRRKAAEIRKQVPSAAAFCSLPDLLVYLPRVMYTMARAGGSVSLSQLAASQAMPIEDTSTAGWLRTIVRKDEAGPFALTLTGKVAAPGIPVKVYGPDNKPVLETTVPAGTHSAFKITVPDAGKGEYVIFIKARDTKEYLFVPLTTLPEVYRVGYWSQHLDDSRFFIRAAGNAPESFAFKPHGGSAYIVTDDQRELASTEKGEMVRADVGPEGAWVLIGARYVMLDGPATLSVSPDRWFAPSPDKLTLKPGN